MCACNMLCHFARAVITAPQMGWLKQQTHFLTCLEVGSVRSRCSQGSVSLRPLSSAVSSVSTHGLLSVCTFVLFFSL